MSAKEEVLMVEAEATLPTPGDDLAGGGEVGVVVEQQEHEGEGEVFQIVLESEDGSTQTTTATAVNTAEGLRLLPDVGQDGSAATAVATTLAGTDHAGGAITYIIEDGLAAATTDTADAGQLAAETTSATITADVAEEEDVEVNITAEEEGEEELTHHFVMDDEQATEVLHSATHHADLLHMIQSSLCHTFDFPVFCSDGVAWTDRLILAALSPEYLKPALMPTGDAGFEEEAATCLVVPALKRSEFEAFHGALFAKESDHQSMNFVVLVKVAEVLGANLHLTTDLGPSSADDPLPEVDYRCFTFQNPIERLRVLRSLGFVEPDLTSALALTSGLGQHSAGSTSGGGGHNADGGGIGGKMSHLCHLFDRELQCPSCPRMFIDEQSLKRHKAQLHELRDVAAYVKSARTYNCSDCDKSFSYAVSLKQHRWLAHDRPVLPMPVPQRPQTTTTSTQKTQKASAATLDDAASMAGALVGGKSRLKKKERLDDMKCSFCGFEATTWKQLEVHTMDHTKQRPFKCDICGKDFKERQKLRRHSVIHTGEKAFKCSFCGKAFGLKHNMRVHEKIHKGTGHKCSYCDRAFTVLGNMRDHEKEHVKKRHQPTEDQMLKEKQRLTKSRGRPAIDYLDRKRKWKANNDADNDAEEDVDDPKENVMMKKQAKKGSEKDILEKQDERKERVSGNVDNVDRGVQRSEMGEHSGTIPSEQIEQVKHFEVTQNMTEESIETVITIEGNI